ncbi:MAG: hypothetical protein DI536_06210 [Archangium gephyra]|uniref:OB domain-containing protein n=1 Tax=Archangium gephyra TaxID=48 RepID=A0A2W5TTY1_9BACT|nr:MAG: hypothetical protein DI536_06210 [Archangium gephyra]
MSQTENTESNSSDERIRKIYAKDLKVGETVHTVFRAAVKEKHTSRGGKSYLALQLVDRTGAVDGRVFDNVDAADQAFSTDDFLLVKGKVGQFKGVTQIVVERLERLDPGPIDANEFAYTAPAPAPREDKPAAKERDEHTAAKVRLSKRLERLLENPQLVQALDNFVGHLEKALNAQHGHAPAVAKPERAERPDRPKRERGPKVEHKARPEEPKRDPSLPSGLAFKPFNALVGGDDTKPPEPSNG